MNNGLDINGKRYISSRRGAEITGYTMDYIGQLCRSGKLESKMVGNVRFVSERSLSLYVRERMKGDTPKSTAPKAVGAPTPSNLRKDQNARNKFLSLKDTGPLLPTMSTTKALVTLSLIVVFGAGIVLKDEMVSFAKNIPEKISSFSSTLSFGEVEYNANIGEQKSDSKFQIKNTLSNIRLPDFSLPKISPF